MPGATWQCATDGKCAFLPRRTLEIGVAHADEYDARLALTKRCFVLAEIGTFAANSPFGRFAFSAGMAVAFGKPRVSAVTEPQEAIIIAGLLSFEWRSGHIGVRCQ